MTCRQARAQACRGKLALSGCPGRKSQRAAAGWAGGAGDGGRWPRCPAHPDRRSLPQLQVTFGGQLAVGGADRATGNAQVAGQRPGGRKRAAHGQPAIPDGVPQRALDALPQAGRPVQVDQQVQATGPVRSPRNWIICQCQFWPSLMTMTTEPNPGRLDAAARAGAGAPQARPGPLRQAAVHAVLDAAPYCHVATVRDGRPVVLPMAHGRLGGLLVLHGSRPRACSATRTGAARSASPRPCSTGWCWPVGPQPLDELPFGHHSRPRHRGSPSQARSSPACRR